MCARQRVAEVLSMTNFTKVDMWLCLDDRSKGLLDCAIDCVKIYDTVFLIILYIPQDCVDACFLLRPVLYI